MKVNNQVLHIGTLEGPLLFFGGAYSNLQALEALRVWAEVNGYLTDQIFCTGDLLGYCAQPVECIRLVQEWGIRSIAGNVELQIREGAADCGCDFSDGGRCDLFSKKWYAHIQQEIDAASVEWLHTLPHEIRFQYEGRECGIIHGSPFEVSQFIFGSTSWEVKKSCFDATSTSVLIAGHSGLPFAKAADNHLWLNAGVIGMPANDGNAATWFVTLSPGGLLPSYQFHQLVYDYQTASSLMEEKGLPLPYAQTLRTGIWDNCEILPPFETGRQGLPLITEYPLTSK